MTVDIYIYIRRQVSRFKKNRLFKKIDYFGNKFEQKKEDNVIVDKKIVESENKILKIKREREEGFNENILDNLVIKKTKV